jgi:CRP/FNR family transcriptional regulator
MLKQEWLEIYPALGRLDPKTEAQLGQSIKVVSLPQGTRPFQVGDACANWYMLLKGSIRVYQSLPNGREMIVCRIYPGKTCILSALALLANEPYTADAVAESPIEVMVVPGATFRQLLAESEAFREFVFTAYNAEVQGLMSLVEDVAFRRIDSRLAACLLARAAEAEAVTGTHQDLAIELGTAREVVSRQLKTFEQRGWVRSSRGRIDLLNPTALRQAAHQIPA